MNEADEFFNFMVLYELLFPDDENGEVTCPHCGRVVKGSEKVKWVTQGTIFKCPDCEEEVEIDV